METVALYLITALFMLAFDMIWLTLRSSYNNSIISSVQGSLPKIRLIPAALIYILIPLTVLIFAVMPSMEMEMAIARGAFLGFAMYGVYDLTNYATLNGWTLNMTVTDMAWGTFICGFTAAFAFYIKQNKFLKGLNFKNLNNLKNIVTEKFTK